jgi:SAM-dependent methyltransferase
VFNNLLSKDDLPLLLEKIRQGHGPRVLRMLISVGSRRRVERMWAVTESPPKHWGSLEAVQRRWNLLTTGDTDETLYDYVARTHLADRSDRVALSLACGTGAHEVRFAQTGRFARIDAFDISPARIENARERANREGLEETLRFEVGDARTLNLPDSSYDLIIAMNALHHFTPLKPVVAQMRALLNPGGLIVLRDYVGPDRFQWTSRQIDAADELLRSLPVRYRIHWGSDTVKKRNYRPGRLAVWFSDPSEAAESSQILPLLDEAFETVERKDLGGAILHLVLKDIAHHFARHDPKADKHLERLMAAEDELMARGEVGSDFAFGIWVKESPKSEVQRPTSSTPRDGT